MNRDDLERLQQKVSASPALTQLSARLQQALTAQASGDNTIAFDPMLILMIISILLQVIRLCIERNEESDRDFAAVVQNIGRVDGRRTLRLRRRLNRLWTDYCAEHGIQPAAGSENPLLAAVLTVSRDVDARAAQDLLKLADEE